MANSVGSAANSSSRRCFTLVKVTTPIPARAVLPTKFAVAEKHMGNLPSENYTHRRGNLDIPRALSGVAPRSDSRFANAKAQRYSCRAQRSPDLRTGGRPASRGGAHEY